MAKDLQNEQDVKESKKALASEGRTLKIENGQTPVFILSSKYEDGFVHWGNGTGGRVRVVCGGGVTGKGFAPDSCDLCAVCLEGYQKARELTEAGQSQKGEKIKKDMNDLKAKYESLFIAAKGEVVVIKDSKTGKKKKQADFEDADVGVLSLTKTQYQDMTGLVGSDEFPFIEKLSDLLNRALILDKAIRGDSRYPTIKFIPSRNQIDAPKVEWDEDEYPLAEEFDIDRETLKELADYYREGKAEPDHYEEEDDVDEFINEGETGDEDFDDDFLSDVDDEPEEAEAEEAPAKEEPVKEKAKTTTKSKGQSATKAKTKKSASKSKKTSQRADASKADF